ncbi:regulator of cell cycle RGCC-like isoform X1 [Pristis pectinata]|uniref:regulator of cell cycle RGCC-like isoform X1 n=1 Tax=Pristis pectinata TaxID=685728 RepID=UPI00223E8D41|nr:regulator of cell cycle RGCC-like isoform X1 [Pristis pectinata]
MSSPDAGNSVWNEEEFDAVLNEFNVVIDDLSCSAKTGVQYEEHLNQMKRMGATSAMDSGIDDPESTGSSAGSSLNCSVEELNSMDTTTTKAKLGDTKDLEDFIADLDQTLAEMM